VSLIDITFITPQEIVCSFVRGSIRSIFLHLRSNCAVIIFFECVPGLFLSVTQPFSASPNQTPVPGSFHSFCAQEKNTDISINLQNARDTFSNTFYCAGISIKNMNTHIKKKFTNF